jgi:hypothetical protein
MAGKEVLIFMANLPNSLKQDSKTTQQADQAAEKPLCKACAGFVRKETFELRPATAKHKMRSREVSGA